MNKFKVGDRVTHPVFGDATVVGFYEDDFLVRRDDGVKGQGPDREWIAIFQWELKEPTEAELDDRRLQAIFVNTSAMIQAIDSGEVPEDQVVPALYGMSAAYVQILGERFGKSLDERIAKRKAGIAAFAA